MGWGRQASGTFGWQGCWGGSGNRRGAGLRKGLGNHAAISLPSLSCAMSSTYPRLLWKIQERCFFLEPHSHPHCFTAAYSQPQDHPNQLQFSALTTPGLSHLSPHLCGSCLCQLPVRAIPPLPLCLPHELRHHTLLALHSCPTHEGTRASWTGPAPLMTMWPLLAQLRDLCPVMWEAYGVYSIILTELTITL